MRKNSEEMNDNIFPQFPCLFFFFELLLVLLTITGFGPILTEEVSSI